MRVFKQKFHPGKRLRDLWLQHHMVDLATRKADENLAQFVLGIDILAHKPSKEEERNDELQKEKN
jgi:hypothetical protein